MIQAILKGTPYLTEFTNSQITSMADVAEEKGGHGEGFRPHELLEASVATCLAMTARMYAEKNNLVVGEITVQVNLERTETDSVFHYELDVSGDFPEAMKKGMNEAIQQCPLHRTLSKRISFNQLTD